MKCREASNWLMSTLKPVPLLPGLGKHLRACPKCRRLRRRLRRLDQVFQNVPLPADKPAARARIMSSLPALAKPTMPVLVRILRAAVILIVVLPWAALVVSLADRQSTPQEVVRKKDGPIKESPLLKSVQPRGTPEEMLVVRFLEGDLHLAETFTPEEHVPVLAGMANDLSQEILRVARSGQIDDLPLLSALYQRLGQGLVSRAWQVSVNRIGVVVTPVVKQLREAANEIDAAMSASAAPVAAALTRSRDTARSAATLLAALPDEPVWPGATAVIPAPRGSPRTLLASLVQQGLRLTQEDDPLLRVEYCRDVADGMLRVIMMDTIKGDSETATRLGQPLGQFMDRSVKAHINQLPPDDPRKIRLQEVLAGAVSLIQDLKGTLMHAPGGTAIPKERFKELEKMVKEMKKIAESLDPEWKGKKDDPKGKGKKEKDDPKAKGKSKKDDKGKGIKADPKHLKNTASVPSDEPDAWPSPFVYQPPILLASPERVGQHLLPALIGLRPPWCRGAM